MKKVGDILKEYLRDRGWLKENPYAALFSQWDRLAGTALASHTRVKDVRDGVLIVEVDHPGWLQMARMRRDGLLSAAREVAPDALLTDIRFLLDFREP